MLCYGCSMIICGQDDCAGRNLADGGSHMAGDCLRFLEGQRGNGRSTAAQKRTQCPTLLRRRDYPTKIRHEFGAKGLMERVDKVSAKRGIILTNECSCNSAGIATAPDGTR